MGFPYIQWFILMYSLKSCDYMGFEILDSWTHTSVGKRKNDESCSDWKPDLLLNVSTVQHLHLKMMNLRYP